ncbi:MULTISPECIES: DUF4234 domain-containing protein [unclassified Vibrio]|uniref:DUF4234 domain-containing protein n=1 Tax=unclassified Vibrio TaxID=2614977 RepID=UPI00136147E7|nr:MULTISPECIES: DUF4234 domain-containing protein [unclassified Vibrio]NAW56251.1 DUF4234 domain-containing protein [Vibrio sp. V36_P2S2PM302]NAX19756.1 DUF4234 domain-containing protein [Vibrio sp. V39_P1S14PM300]NAX27414.1 DUF4234 domain-containing protein [Vibrio sp. V38_P2S17PM301]NAX31758.1 DUF4234 domain-containing protein [Vibrio sp. V37_P2S8PM304]
MDRNLIRQLQSQSSWRLFFLALVTLGIYTAYYAKSQSEKINALPHGMTPINQGFMETVFGLACIGMMTRVLSILLYDNLMLSLVDNLIGLSVSIMLLIWGFKARNRVNAALGFEPGSARAFSALFTVLFTPLYFNYKVNCLCEELDSDEQSTQTQLDA